MAIKDYSNGTGPLSAVIQGINDREEQAERAHREHAEAVAKVGLGIVLGSLIQRFVESRR